MPKQYMLILLTLIAFTMVACGGSTGTKLVTTQTDGDISVSVFVNHSKPVFKKGNNNVELKFTKNGKAFDAGKEAKLEFYMPAMPPSMPEMKNVGVATYTGDGIYKGNVNLEMGQKWNVTIFFKSDGQEKSILFDTIADE